MYHRFLSFISYLKQLTFWGGMILIAGNMAVNAQTFTSLSPTNPFLPEDEVIAKPIQGWVEFCEREPEECTIDLSEPSRLTLTPSIWKKIVHVNRLVNETIIQRTDMEIYATEDLWTLPYNGEGDCEDFQLLKRHMLVKAGVPARTMRMTVVIDEEKQGHAVLMVLTDRGDFILDNKTSHVVTYDKTPYQYVKRESGTQIGWISFRGTSHQPTVTANH